VLKLPVSGAIIKLKKFHASVAIEKLGQKRRSTCFC